MVLLGVALAVLGVLAVGAGIVGAVRKMVNEPNPKKLAAPTSNSVSEIITAATEFLKVLISAPTWLALTIVGGALIAEGVRLIGG